MDKNNFVCPRCRKVCKIQEGIVLRAIIKEKEEKVFGSNKFH